MRFDRFERVGDGLRRRLVEKAHDEDRDRGEDEARQNFVEVEPCVVVPDEHRHGADDHAGEGAVARHALPPDRDEDDDKQGEDPPRKRKPSPSLAALALALPACGAKTDYKLNEKNFFLVMTNMWYFPAQYLGCDECAPATLRLLDHLSMALGVALDGGTLVGKAERWRGKASALMRCNDDLNAYVKELERAYDGESPTQDMPPFNAPQAEQLVKEAEEFLKDCGGNPAA